MVDQTSKKRISAKEKQAKALGLRKEGKSYDEIAVSVGYKSRQGAQQAVKRALDALVGEPAVELVQVELARLDDLQSAHTVAARGGDARATEVVLKVMEQRAKLLGLNHNERKLADAAEASVRLQSLQVDALLECFEDVLGGLGLDAAQLAAWPGLLRGALVERGLVPGGGLAPVVVVGELEA